MRILILSCNTGQGHNSAASALKEVLTQGGHEYVIKSALSFLSPTADELICDGHVFIYRNLPKLFGFGYRYEERHSPRFICNQMKRGVDKFYEYMSGESFDAVICVHVFGALLVNETKKACGLKIFSCLVSTDYTCSPCFFESDADLYFIPHPALKWEFMRAGIAENKLCASGIPIHSSFFSSVPKAQARKSLSLNLDKKTVLIGTGSFGCGPIAEIVEYLSLHLKSDGNIIIACGKNEKLLNRINKLKFPNVSAIPYTDKMSLYMDAADIFLTKAGGLSTTEAIIKRIPLVYINAVPGCETRNIDFMVQNDFAYAAFSPQGSAELVLTALGDIEKSVQMISECRKDIPDNPSEFICDTVISKIK